MVYQLLDVHFYIATDVSAIIQIGTSNDDDTQIWIYEQDGISGPVYRCWFYSNMYPATMEYIPIL